ncbi:MAG: hypothetical protein PUC33_01615 [Oscillospiraceae bacterium]|nr:hypothetical protein [Oscillospiraceae bacterium]
MTENPLIYPMKTMRITQSYTGRTSHLPHCTGSPKDYPIDEGGKDGGRDWLLCPCDEMKVSRVYGVGTKGTNTLWLCSTKKVTFADGSRDYVTMLVTHPEDDDLKAITTGRTYKRGERICREGKDGASACHLHISAGKGKPAGRGWQENSKGKWVLTCTHGAYPPERLFFADPSLTDILSSGGLHFKTEETAMRYGPGNYRVTDAETLHVRRGPGVIYPKLTYAQLTDDAKKKILTLTGEKRNGYVKGMAFTVSEVKENWGRTPSGWVCLDYCEATP